MKAPNVILAPSQVLRTECTDVDMDTAGQLVAYFVEAWHQNPRGVGIAAPQIGFGARMFVWDPERDTRKGRFGHPEIVINPSIDDSSEETEEQVEGCLSCPGKGADMSRPKWIVVTYTTEQGTKITKRLEGFEARVFQHEFDHLDGKLITDHIKYY
jgi:peptide deformylase